MPSKDLSEISIGFLREHIQSVAQLEILALLQADPQRAWTVQQVDSALSSNEKAVARWLAEFAAGGLVVEEVRENSRDYRYQPKTPSLGEAAAEAIHAFQLKPVLVIETIFKQDRSAQSFSDAFRIRPR